MLNPTEIIAIISSGEGFNAEFKERLPTNLKGITEEVCAFANASGGVVLIGVDDKNVNPDGSEMSLVRAELHSVSIPMSNTNI